MRRVKTTLRGVLAGALALLAPTAASAAEPDWKAIEATAKKAGVVNVYHNFPPPGYEQLFAAFRKAHPEIKIEAVRLGSASLIQRFRTEYATGVSRTDVVLVAWDDVLEKWIKDGWIKKWSPPEAKAYPAGMITDSRLFTTQYYRDVIIYNKTRVKGGDVPKEWTDLFNPKWKGKLGMNPPWRSVTVQGSVAFWEKKLGVKDLAAKLKAQSVRFFNGSSGVTQAVIRGDVLVAQLIDPPVIKALSDGAPIGVVYPKSGIPSIPGIVFVPEKAPRPEAGMVFANWILFLSAAGQLALQEGVGSPAARPGVQAPKLVPANKDLKIVVTPALVDPAYQQEMIKRFRATFNVQ